VSITCKVLLESSLTCDECYNIDVTVDDNDRFLGVSVEPEVNTNVNAHNCFNFVGELSKHQISKCAQLMTL